MKKLFMTLSIFVLLLSLTVSVFAETPELPEGNKLINGKWTKCIGEVSVSESEVDGHQVYSITNFNKSFHTPAVNIYPSIKALMGDEDEVNVWIVFDIKHQGNANKEVGFGMKLRASGIGAGIKTEDGFLENYSEVDTFEFNNGNIYVSIAGKGRYTITNEWTRIQILQTFTSYDINDKFWTGWNLCFDYVDDFNSVGGIQIRNTGIFLEDEYEPVEEEKEPEEEVSKLPSQTPKPAVIYRPYGYDKYTATFTEVVDQNASNAATQKPQSATQKPADTTPIPQETDDDSNVITIAIIAAAAVVVAAGVTVTLILIKKKKSVKKEEE